MEAFKEHYVLFFLKLTNSYTVIESPELIRIGEEEFLSGRCPTQEEMGRPGWVSSGATGVALSAVEQFFVYDSLDEIIDTISLMEKLEVESS